MYANIKEKSSYKNFLTGMKNKLITSILSLVLFLPIIVFAAGLIPCDGVTVKCDFNAFAGLINNIINWFIGISAGVAAITFSIAGAKMLFNPDNPTKRQEAIGMFKKTVIGMLIVLGAWLIVHTIVSALVKPESGALRFLGN